MAAGLDVARAPLGVLVAQELIGAVVELGDMAERHYLELKSTLDLTAKRDKEKIAKFILAAANRMPDLAATAFEGYGVMIVGVGSGIVTGIPQVEMMEISRVIQQYVGAAGPRWDVLWVPVNDSTNQVLVVLVNPPKLGDGPFPCRASGESLTDGRIYVRADGETREAKAEEVDLLIQRGNARESVPVDFGVEVLGDVARFELLDETSIDQYLTSVREGLESALTRNPAREEPQIGSSAATVGGPTPGTRTLSGLLKGISEPETRTEREYLDSIEKWETHFGEAWDEAVPRLISSSLQPAVFRVTNRTTTFFHDVRVKIHLPGGILAVDYEDPGGARTFGQLDLPRPPQRWGPRTVSIVDYFGNLNMPGLYTPPLGPYPPASIRTGTGPFRHTRTKSGRIAAARLFRV